MPVPTYGTCNGFRMSLDLREYIQRSMYLNRYEPTQSGWVRQILKPGGTFLDIGANVGYYTTLAASIVGPTGRVVAFEPSPYAFERLRALAIPQVEAFQCAAGDHEESHDLYVQSHDTRLHSPSLVPMGGCDRVVKVTVHRLDDFRALKGLTIDFMKVDVEGFEPNVLQGAQAMLSANRVRHLMIEFNSGWLIANGASCSELMQLVLSMGFAVLEQTPLVTFPTYTTQDFLFRHVA